MASWRPTSIRGKLWRLQGGCCCYCERPMSLPPRRQPKHYRQPKDQATLEHLRRVEDGGRNIPDNYALACVECNGGRGQMDWLSYKTYVLEALNFRMGLARSAA